MLNGAYAQLKAPGKLILLFILVLSFLLFSTLIGILSLVPFYGSGVIAMLSAPDFSDPEVISAFKVLQVINMTGGLLLPAVIYIWLCEPETWKTTALARPVSVVALLISVIIIISSQPFIGWTSELNSYLDLPEWLNVVETWIKNAEKQNAEITEAFLSTTSTSGLFINIFMIAILPAFAEEILFRGVLAGLFKNWTKNTFIAVIFSAAIFAGIHMQFYGFLPRFFLGVALGYLFFWSGSLWLPIAAHFTNNFLSVIAEYLFRKGIIQTNAENLGMNNTLPTVVLSVIVVTAAMFYIYKTGSGKGINDSSS